MSATSRICDALLLVPPQKLVFSQMRRESSASIEKEHGIPVRQNAAEAVLDPIDFRKSPVEMLPASVRRLRKYSNAALRERRKQQLCVHQHHWHCFGRVLDFRVIDWYR